MLNKQFETIEINGKEYKLAMGINELIMFKDQFKSDPIKEYMKIATANEDDIASIFNADLYILSARIIAVSMIKFNHSIKIDKALDLVDEYAKTSDEGYVGLTNIAVSVLQTSGFFKTGTVENEQ